LAWLKVVQLSLTLYLFICLFIYLFIYIGSTGVWTQDFGLAQWELYCWATSPVHYRILFSIEVRNKNRREMGIFWLSFSWKRSVVHDSTSLYHFNHLLSEQGGDWVGEGCTIYPIFIINIWFYGKVRLVASDNPISSSINASVSSDFKNIFTSPKYWAS
jgi:hypothetical protein